MDAPPNKFGLTFHHMGLALRKEDEALKFLGGLGYDENTQVYDPEQKVYLRLCTSKIMPAVELVTAGEEEGPLTPILKRYAELVYHTCYETKDLDATIQSMESEGLRVVPVSPPKPAILFGGRKVSFYTVMGFGLIEILEP